MKYTCYQIVKHALYPPYPCTYCGYSSNLRLVWASVCLQYTRYTPRVLSRPVDESHVNASFADESQNAVGTAAVFSELLLQPRGNPLVSLSAAVAAPGWAPSPKSLGQASTKVR